MAAAAKMVAAWPEGKELHLNELPKVCTEARIARGLGRPITFFKIWMIMPEVAKLAIPRRAIFFLEKIYQPIKMRTITAPSPRKERKKLQ